MLRSAQTSVEVDPAPADVDVLTIDGGPTDKVSVRVVKPQGMSGPGRDQHQERLPGAQR